MMKRSLTFNQEQDRSNSLGTTNGVRATIIFAEVLICWGLLAAVYLFVGVSRDSFTSTSLMQLAWINNFSLIAQLALLRNAFGSLTAPFVIYALFLSLFTSGQLVLYSFGVKPAGLDVIGREAINSVGRATAFYLTAFSAFCLGAVIVNELKRTKPRGGSASRIETQDWQDSLRWVGIVFVALGIVPFTIQNSHNLRVVFTQGYSRYYDPGARIQSPLLSLGYFFITGLVMLGCCGRPRARNIAVTAMLLLACLRLISGDRGEGMIYLLTAYLVMSAFATVQRRRLVWAGVLAAFAVFAIPTIGSLRQSYGGALAGITIGIGENPLNVTMTTMGATLFPLVAIVELSDLGVQPIMGLSYLGGAVAVLPDALLVGPLLSVAQNTLSASPATWLMQQLGMSYGPGFTPFAEAYLNFGWWGGCFALVAYGAIFALLLRFPTSSIGSDVVRIALVIAIFALIGFSVRGSSNFVLPYLLRYVVVPGIVVVLAARRRGNARLRRSSHGS